MSGLEKYMFLSAVTLAVLVTSQVPDEEPVAPIVPETMPETVPDAPVQEAPPPSILSLAPATTSGHLGQLTACKGQSPSRAPNVDRDLIVTDYKPFVLAGGSVRLATAPVGAGCLSSFFGMRNGRLHKGVDYYNKDAVPVFAAGDGQVRRRQYRSDYGNMIVIDHGDGVYTRYAHLESFGAPEVGNRVTTGQKIGVMGSTAGYSVPRHLHYEVLTGTWSEQAGSFALKPVDVMSLPEARD